METKSEKDSRSKQKRLSREKDQEAVKKGKSEEQLRSENSHFTKLKVQHDLEGSKLA